jgi:hypothetical protein
MALMTQQELDVLSSYIVMRTEHGNEIVSRNPREMPRRLRVLLLSIDGAQNVKLYTQTLKGFGNVSELLIELINLGLVRVVEPALAKKERAAGKSEQYAALDQLLDDSKFNSESAADVLYGSTTPGSFDDMLRVARIERPQYEPPPAPPPAPIAPTAQKEQIESLFNLLDAVRGERMQLKQQIVKLQRVKEAAARLQAQNQKLQNWVYGLSSVSVVLAVSLLLMAFRR